MYQENVPLAEALERVLNLAKMQQLQLEETHSASVEELARNAEALDKARVVHVDVVLGFQLSLDQAMTVKVRL